MKRVIKIFCIVIMLHALSMQHAQAFWGKKKTADKAEPKKTEQKVKEESAPAEKKKEAAKEVSRPEVKAEMPQEPETKKAVKKEIDKETLERMEKQKLERQKKRKQLDNTTWAIELTAVQKKGNPKKDTLVFQENRFYAEGSSKEGFNATNYTLTIKDNGITIWETMQTGEGGKINFWRGEITADMQSMSGIISKRSSEGETENFAFTSKEKNSIKK